MNWENKKTWSFQDKCLYFKRWIIMKQLSEVMNFASLTENHPKYNTELFHKIKENIWLKNMYFIKLKRRFVLFRNIVDERVFDFIKYLPRVNGKETLNRSNKSFLSVSRIFKIQTTLQYFLWEETGVPGENPQLSSKRWLTLFNTIRLDLNCFFIVLTRKSQMAKFEAFVTYNKATWRLYKNLFSYNSKTLPNVKTSWRNDYFFKKKILLFSRRNTNFEILSFRVIYFSDCVFNLTVLKWLDITNFIFSNKKVYREKAKQSMIRHFWRSQYVHRTKWNAFFIKMSWTFHLD